MRQEEQQLDDIGNTIHNSHLLSHGNRRNPVQAALVVGNTLTSHYWLNILPMARNPALRYYITEDDLQTISDRLHVHPNIMPSFLVFYYRYIVDWFPAPLPPAGGVQDPFALLTTVQERLQQYA